MAKAKRHIEIIGVPVDLGAGRRGVDMGPSAIRIAELESRLELLGHTVVDYGDLDVMIPETQQVGAGKLRYKAPILAACESLRAEVERSLNEGRMPLVLGGDHSIAIGTVAGSSNYLAAQGESLGLIWFDAHGDGTAGVHLSFDLDVVDPEDAPGTGTPVWGGISYREAHLAMEMLADRANIVAIDLVEVNPVLDTTNMTGILAAELAQSLLGKRIL